MKQKKQLKKSPRPKSPNLLLLTELQQHYKLRHMKVVIQKSGPASVEIEGKEKRQINKGLVILLGITNGDTEKDIEYLVEKICNLRIFPNGEKHFDLSILDTKEEILLISQFTLYASCKKGRRPDFNDAAKPEIAKPLYEKFIEKLKAQEITVKTGEFGAMMQVNLTNQGPTTIIIDSKL